MFHAYTSDFSTQSVKVHKNPHIYQRRDWGGHWREGYLGWAGNPGFFGFSFSFYLFTPFYEPCFVSPWYNYTCLPPYIPADLCDVSSGYSCQWDSGTEYRTGRDSNDDPNLDDAISRLENAFNDQDFTLIDSLMPAHDQVAVFTDGDYDYSMAPQDFDMMMADAITNTDTVSFDVTDVRTYGNTAVIQARHEVEDPDGTFEVVNQRYRLRMEGGGLVITDFMTSQ